MIPLHWIDIWDDSKIGLSIIWGVTLYLTQLEHSEIMQQNFLFLVQSTADPGNIIHISQSAS